MALSWLDSANNPASDFPLENLPYGVFVHGDHTRIGVAIGDQILDLHAAATHGLLAHLSGPLQQACRAGLLNPLMSLGPGSWSALRETVTALLDADQAIPETQRHIAGLLVPIHEATLQLPARIGDYTDFYASIHHANRVGRLFRPDIPLLPNYKHIPIGYHGRASSIVLSGQDIPRPSGQILNPSGQPVFARTQRLDFELEIGLFVGPGNPLGHPIPITQAEHHIFGLCLLNDWSARDLQSWEYQPLGPFLAKSFATSISPWIVPLEALAPFRIPAPPRPAGDPAPLPYLTTETPHRDAFDLNLEVTLQSSRMRAANISPLLITQANLRELYWTPAQLIAHHTSNGCNLRPGDLLATGTISGSNPGSEGCLLELQSRESESQESQSPARQSRERQLRCAPLRLPTGELRSFLEDGDQVTFHAHADAPGHPRIGFGACTGTVTGSVSPPST